ncbi:MAG: MFS transporter [Thermomicrobiales bacterium]
MQSAPVTPGVTALDAIESGAQPRLSQPWHIWLACACVTAANQADPPIWLLLSSVPEQSFGAAWVRYWSIASTTTVTLLLFIIAGGVLGDLLGRRRVLLTGVALYVASAGLSLGAVGAGWLLLGNALLGIGAALTIPLALANIRLTFRQRRLPLALALHTAISGVVSLGVAALGPLIRAQFGWRALFLPPFLLGCIAFWVCWRHIPESRAEGSYRRSDAIAIAAWSLTILPITYIAIKIGAVGFFSTVVYASLGVAGIGFACLVWQERRAASPLRRSLPYPVRTLVIIIFTGLTLNFALWGYTVQIHRFLQSVLNFSPVLAALALVPSAIGIGVGFFTAARLTRQRSPGGVIGGSLLVMALAVICTSGVSLFFRAATPYWLLAALMVTLVLGYLFASTAWNSAYLSLVPTDLVGVGAAISSGAAQLGAVLASTLLGTLLIDFGERDFEERLRSLGLSPEQGEQARAALALALQADPTFDAASLPAPIQALLGSYQESYAIAFGQVLLVAALMLTICAGIVWFGLRALRPRTS